MIIQFKKGIMELCILCMLEKGDCYGYDIANRLSRNIDISEGSVYPVLRRMKKDGELTSYLAEASGDLKSTRLNSSHTDSSRMPSSA